MSDTIPPEGHVDEVGCWCGPTVHPVSGLGHTLSITTPVDRPGDTDVRAWLDRLDQAHAAIGDSPAFRVLGYVQDDENPEQVLARFDDGGMSVFAECYGADAARLIVAAVNALPQFVAAVRAGLALADELDRKANNLISENRTQPRDSLHRKYATGHATALQGAADDLRTTLTAPLAGQHTTDEEADRG